MGRFWHAASRLMLRHPTRVLLGVVVVAVLLGLGAVRLHFETSQDTLVDPDSQVAKDNARYQDTFGGEPMLVLLTGDIREMAASGALEEVRALEEALRDTGQFETVVGPATALDFAAAQLSVAPQLLEDAAERAAARAAADARAEAEAAGASPAEQDQAAAAASQRVLAEHQAATAEQLERLTAAGEPSLDNPEFVEFLIFDGDGDIRAAMRDAFIDEGHAMVLARLPGNAPIADQSEGVDAVDQVVENHPITGMETLASGPPVLLAEINDYLQGGMVALGALALAVMLVLLVLVFRARWPLLPLLVVLVGTVAAFGAVGLFDIPLTLVTISALPILLGLGVDFAIQMHNRFEEERTDGHPPDVAADQAMRHIGPPVMLAMAAAVVGFLALQWSGVPMVRDFGALLSVGVVVLVLVAVAAVVPILLLRDRRPEAPQARAGWVERAVRAISSLPARTAPPLLVVGAVVTVFGFIVEGGLPIQTDPEAWVDQEGRAVTDLRELREGTGFSSELTMMVEADDVTDADVAAWTQQMGAETVDRHPAVLLRATSLASIATGVHGTVPGGNDLELLLSVAPEDIARSLISEDRTKANVVFPIGPVSLEERERVLDEIVADLGGDLAPPAGVTATPSGLAVIGVELVNNLEAGRRSLSLIALGLVLAWLVLTQRTVLRPILVLAPVAVAVAISSLAIAALDIELTPLTTVVGPLVIAICTEFTILVGARYVEDRAAGLGPRDAVASGVPRIGRAFVASGLTLIGGFSVLALSAMPLLRDFGVVVALDVAIALASTLVLLPPLLVWTDERGWLRIPASDADLPQGARRDGARPRSPVGRPGTAEG